MANQDDGFLRELEEELRRERLEKIWQQYGTYIIAAALLIVFGVLGYKYLENRRIVAAQTAGARYESAMALAAEGKEGSAAKEFETLAAEGTGGYPALAQLQLAGALLKEGKKAEGLAAYEKLANDGDADALLRDYAALQAAAVRLGEADFTEMQNRLNPLMGDESPWRYSARELLGLAAFKAGKAEDARTVLTPLLVDQKTPQTIIERAQIILAEIAAADIAKKAGNEPAPASAATAAESTPADKTPSGTKKE
jgi:hypothetical protein